MDNTEKQKLVDKCNSILRNIIPSNVIKYPDKALWYFIGSCILGNTHIRDPTGLAQSWLSGFDEQTLREIPKEKTSDWKNIYMACRKTGYFAIIPLVLLIERSYPRALIPQEREQCCANYCHNKRQGEKPACESHLCTLCGWQSEAPGWQKYYYHVDGVHGFQLTAFHILSLDPAIMNGVRQERTRECFRPLADWCYGARRMCAAPIPSDGCLKESLPTPIQQGMVLSVRQSFCGPCWLYYQCTLCKNRATAFSDPDRLKSRVCDASYCNIKVNCRRCGKIRFARPDVYLRDKLLCKDCQKEAYHCTVCHRTSNNLQDMMWAVKWVWHDQKHEPTLCVRCIPGMTKFPGIPNGNWMQRRTMVLRIWWDRKAVLSHFEEQMQTRPLEFFKGLTKLGRHALALCEHDPNNWLVLYRNPAMWDCTYFFFVQLLRHPRDIFVKILRLL